MARSISARRVTPFRKSSKSSVKVLRLPRARLDRRDLRDGHYAVWGIFVAPSLLIYHIDRAIYRTRAPGSRTRALSILRPHRTVP